MHFQLECNSDVFMVIFQLVYYDPYWLLFLYFKEGVVVAHGL